MTPRAATQNRPTHMFGMQLAVFVMLIALFLLALGIFNTWGRRWAEAAYWPVLADELASACTAQNCGAAERKALLALDTTPAYAPAIVDAFLPELVVMPELSARLLETFKRNGSLSNAENRLNAMRVMYVRGMFGKVVEQNEGDRASDILGWHTSFLREMSCPRMGLPYGVASQVEQRQILPDSAYRLGLAAEIEGKRTEAMNAYALAIGSSDAALDAATGYLRLARSSGTNNVASLSVVRDCAELSIPCTGHKVSTVIGRVAGTGALGRA